MLVSEFIDRTGYQPTAEEYAEIERAYYEYDGDKDKFCRAWSKANPHKAGKLWAAIKEQQRLSKVFDKVAAFVRKHLCTIETSKATFDDAKIADPDGDFFYDGNVLLRLNLNKDKVETSKSIRIPVEVCKKMWKIVSKWHENPSCFKPMEIDTNGSGRYTISSYKNDILTAGCHKIAYTEMERMYNEIINA